MHYFFSKTKERKKHKNFDVCVTIFVHFFLLTTIKMTNEETITVYYNKKQLIAAGGVTTVKLFSDRDRKNVVGQAIYSIESYDNFATGEIWTTEDSIFFFGDIDTISFQVNTKEKNAILPEGSFTYSIICGQGKYLGATGTVNFKITAGGLRIITIKVKLA